MLKQTELNKMIEELKEEAINDYEWKIYNELKGYDYEEVKEIVEDMKGEYVIYTYEAVKEISENLLDIFELINNYKEELGIKIELEPCYIINSIYNLIAFNIENRLEIYEEVYEEEGEE